MKNTKNYDEQPVNTRIKIAGLWASMLFVFAYVDVFGLFRKDVLENALAGKVFTFEVNQMFLLLTTVYILIPCIMLVLTLVLKAKTSRMLNIVISSVYILTIIGGVVGESWLYYIVGSVVEVLLLATIVLFAVKWPKTN